MKTKICKKCNIKKNIREFNKCDRYKGGYKHICNSCCNIYIKRRFNRLPWYRHYTSIISRCHAGKHYKGKIFNYLKPHDVKYLWFRDRAYLLTRPSIDRIDPQKDYTLDNCRFIEYLENCKQGGRTGKRIQQHNLDNKLIKTWNSIIEICRELNYSREKINYSCYTGKIYNGYKWKHKNQRIVAVGGAILERS